MSKNDKYACFQWIRDVRSRMSADMEGMTPDERVIYSRERAEKALSAMPRLSLEEARQRRQAMLCPEQSLTPSRKPRNIANPTARRKPAKRLVHA